MEKSSLKKIGEGMRILFIAQFVPIVFIIFPGGEAWAALAFLALYAWGVWKLRPYHRAWKWSFGLICVDLGMTLFTMLNFFLMLYMSEQGGIFGLLQLFGGSSVAILSALLEPVQYVTLILLFYGAAKVLAAAGNEKQARKNGWWWKLYLGATAASLLLTVVGLVLVRLRVEITSGLLMVLAAVLGITLFAMSIWSLVLLYQNYHWFLAVAEQPEEPPEPDVPVESEPDEAQPEETHDTE